MIEDGYRHKGLRRLLVKQLKTKGITDEKVLRAMEAIPRHVFFDNIFLEKAYQDIAFPIGEGQTISQPYTVAFQTQLLDIKSTDKVLEIGTGSGYQACVLAEMGVKLYSIERNNFLHNKSKQIIKKLNYSINCVLGDGTLGLKNYAPFDKIIVTAGAPTIPPMLLEQLSVKGILVIPVGDDKKQTMLRIEKTENGNLIQEKYDNFRFVPLIGANGW